MSKLIANDLAVINSLVDEYDVNIQSAAAESSAKVEKMTFPILSMMFGDLTAPVLWRILGLVDRLHNTEERVTLLSLVTDYISHECTALGMCDMVNELSGRWGKNHTNYIQQLATVWNKVLIKAKSDLRSDSYSSFVENLCNYTRVFESHGMDKYFTKTLELANNLKSCTQVHDIEHYRYDNDVSIYPNIPSTAKIPFRTMDKIIYASYTYCPLYEKELIRSHVKHAVVDDIAETSLDSFIFGRDFNFNEKTKTVKQKIDTEDNRKSDSGFNITENEQISENMEEIFPWKTTTNSKWSIEENVYEKERGDIDKTETDVLKARDTNIGEPDKLASTPVMSVPRFKKTIDKKLKGISSLHSDKHHMKEIGVKSSTPVKNKECDIHQKLHNRLDILLDEMEDTLNYTKSNPDDSSDSHWVSGNHGNKHREKETKLVEKDINVYHANMNKPQTKVTSFGSSDLFDNPAVIFRSKPATHEHKKKKSNMKKEKDIRCYFSHPLPSTPSPAKRKLTDTDFENSDPVKSPCFSLSFNARF